YRCGDRAALPGQSKLHDLRRDQRDDEQWHANGDLQGCCCAEPSYADWRSGCSSRWYNGTSV
ncbi:hypothetical protein LTR66_015857, partial [Elasticomyces elasticus]